MFQNKEDEILKKILTYPPPSMNSSLGNDIDYSVLLQKMNPKCDEFGSPSSAASNYGSDDAERVMLQNNVSGMNNNFSSMKQSDDCRNESYAYAKQFMNQRSGDVIEKKSSNPNVISNLTDYFNPAFRPGRVNSEKSLMSLGNGFMSEPPNKAIMEAAIRPLSNQQKFLLVENKPTKIDSYKTVMCQAWLENKTCKFGDRCRFAHGETQLMPMNNALHLNNKYKTKLCERYNLGVCPYGNRCLFIHPNNKGNAYFNNDKLSDYKYSAQGSPIMRKRTSLGYGEPKVKQYLLSPRHSLNVTTMSNDTTIWSPERASSAGHSSFLNTTEQTSFGSSNGSNKNCSFDSNNENQLPYSMFTNGNPLAQNSELWRMFSNQLTSEHVIQENNVLTPNLASELSRAFETFNDFEKNKELTTIFEDSLENDSNGKMFDF